MSISVVGFVTTNLIEYASPILVGRRGEDENIFKSELQQTTFNRFMEQFVLAGVVGGIVHENLFCICSNT